MVQLLNQNASTHCKQRTDEFLKQECSEHTTKVNKTHNRKYKTKTKRTQQTNNHKRIHQHKTHKSKTNHHIYAMHR